MKDLNQDYEGVFGNRLGFGEHPAVVAVDICRAYLQEDSPLYAGVEDAVASAARIIDAARAAEVPVMFTRVEYEPDGSDGGVFFRKVPALASFVRGNPLGDFPDEPRPRDGESVFTKQYASAFFGTTLAEELRARGIDTVIIVGLSTSGCVRASALDACQEGFVPIVVRDAVGDRDPRPHESNLFDLNAKYADVLGEDEVLTYLKERR